MKFINNKGISLIEAIASIVIISFVMAASFSIILNIRNQTNAANEKINAIEVGTMIRDNILNELTYTDLLNWLDTDKIIDGDNCSLSSAPFSCDLFTVTLDGKDYSSLIELTFYKPTTTEIGFGIINYKVVINYYSSRTIELVGVVYE